MLPSALGGMWDLYGGVWGHDTERRNVFEFYQLPSEIRKIPLRRWQLALDVRPRDFSFDPSQDLLVLVVNEET